MCVAGVESIKSIKRKNAPCSGARTARTWAVAVLDASAILLASFTASSRVSGFIFQFPAMKGRRAISRASGAASVRCEPGRGGGGAAGQRRLRGRAGIGIGSTLRAAAVRAVELSARRPRAGPGRLSALGLAFSPPLGSYRRAASAPPARWHTEAT